MNKNLWAAHAARWIVAATLLPAAWLCAAPSSAQPTAPLKIGFVYVSPITPAGWTQQHDQGRAVMVAALGKTVSATVVENVAEGADAERVMRDLAAQGHQLIVAPSFGYMEPLLRVAKDFPQVKFESITGYKRSANVATANARYYEGRYLAGIAAGRVSGQLGYVAGFPIPEVLQGINAFALGALSVNPQATVRVVWLNEWFNPPKEREAAMSLFNQGVDVLAFHTGSSAIMAAAQERGKWAIGYHSNMAQVGPQAQLLAVTHHWGEYYTERARALASGQWASTDTWGGIAQGMVDVGHFGPKLPRAVVLELQAAKARIQAGTLRPFAAGAATVLDNTGAVMIAAGATLSDPQILGMNVLVRGVLGGPPGK